MAETTMTNIDIRDFVTVQGADDGDYVVMSLSGGTSAKMAVGLLRSSISSGAVPSIKDGMWWIGPEDTGVPAEGKTPEFRRADMGIEYKYTTEGEESWKLLIGIAELRFRFDDLTEEQRSEISLKFSDLTPEEITELQKPASDMIGQLQQTDSDMKEAESARQTEFDGLKSEMETATANAQDTADHPTYVGEDNYVYQWNKQTKTYDKTGVYVRGEAFTIRKVYGSVAEMYADTATSFREGDFCLINTGDVENPENAQIFVRSAVGSWDFLVDMSGAIGFTGKVPQLFIGTVAIGSGKESAAVTLTPSGTDSDGNPMYNINYVIPCLSYEDLTPEQIAELQRPANEMIARLQATDDAVKAAEALRVSAEEERAEEFARLKNESETATAGAVTATTEADAARDAAHASAQAADESARKAETAAASADTATANANRAADSANTATANADAAVDKANTSAQNAMDSAAKADTSAKGADAAAARADAAAEKADAATERANTATDAADVAASSANTAAGSANDSAGQATEAAETANVAAQKARNLPKIQNGTWWLYDVSTDTYVDSGYAVSSDYVLTREKIEGVFQGNVESHWHDIYINKVEGKGLSTEDFTTALKEKLESLDNYDDTAITAVVNTLRDDFDTLVSGDTTDAIESFREITAFLEGVSDTQSLEGIVASIQAEIAKKASPSDIPTKVGQLENDASYATTAELASGLAAKQGTIDDLEDIRSGSALGATALQEVPEGYVTEERLSEGLGLKQDRNLYFTDLAATDWVEDPTYEDFAYRCDLPCPGVTERHYAEVVFGMEQFTSKDYAPICETKEGIVSIWADLAEAIVVPTVIAYR